MGAKAAVVLSDLERTQLQRWARRAKTAQYLASRAKIVLRAAQGGTDGQAAAEVPPVARSACYLAGAGSAPSAGVAG